MVVVRAPDKVANSQSQKALSELVSKELILDKKGSDSQTHFRINQAKYKEIQSSSSRRISDFYGKVNN